jgi:tetratricopeptide (TPR) repeat protein
MASPPSPVLPPGTLLGGRFVLEHPAGRGGMGTVFRARDTRTEQAVALKLMHATDSEEAIRRFTREAEVLARLSHPGIVAYVAHGIAEGNQPFLAMEWLEGESLLQRLGRQPLHVAETLAMLRRIAESLDAAHQRGIIHRDLKPSNLFLRSGRPEDVVILDFGLARHVLPSQALTLNAVLLGTPGYMAPEQASSQMDVTPGADIFSLGCVLYECLTGKQPFMAPLLQEVLAKILLAEPRPLRELREDLPASWQMLLNAMLAKDPKQRLPDARGLLAALSAIEEGRTDGLPPAREAFARPPSGLSGQEQQLVSVLLAVPLLPEADQPTVTYEQPTVVSRAPFHELRTALETHGARVERLVDGSLLAAFLPERGTATDQAALAARGALFLKERWPGTRMVLVTGRGVLSGKLLVGEAMDRAGALLRRLESEPGSAHVALDGLTAGLLGPGFLLAPAGEDTFLLQGEHVSVDETRPLLGRPTPCVGRELELSMLEGAFTTCLDEPSARAVLVTAPAGMGKSRLRHEFLRRLEQRGPRVLVLMGRGEPLSAKAAGGLLSQALLRLCGIQEAEPPTTRQEKFAQRISRNLSPEQAPEALEFLGELCGVSSLGDASPRLRAAREDPALMSAQVSRVLVSFLAAECARGPVLLVLEDLHWCDELTVRFVDEALRALAECPLMVLALGRPEVKTSFPGLWSHCLTEVRLGALSKRAGSRLVHEVLGEKLSQSTSERLVEQAAGNALFLEELIRAVKEGRGESPPRTVLAMLQARILRLEPEARQVLLAASLLSRAFWAGAVRAILEEGPAVERLEHWLQLLVEQELIEPEPKSRFPTEREFHFRHALLRDAALELVPGNHKPAAHRRVGAWLEQVGEPDALVLAEHFLLGQEQERAIHFYTRASEECRGLELPRVLQSLEAAVASGPSVEVKAQLLRILSLAYMMMGAFDRALPAGREALPGLKPGSTPWCKLMSSLIYASLMGREHALVLELGLLLFSQDPDTEAVESYVDTLCFMAALAICGGRRPEATRLLTRAEQVSAPLSKQRPFHPGMLGYTQAMFTYAFEARPWRAWVLAAQAIQVFQEQELERQIPSARGAEREWKQMTWLLIEGSALAALGDWEGAAGRLHEAQALARRLGRPIDLHYTDAHTLMVLCGSPEAVHREEARTLALQWAGVPSPNPAMSCQVHMALCRLLEDPREAEAYGYKACEPTEFLIFEHFSHLALSSLFLAQGRAAEAREAATRGVRQWEKMEGAGAGAVAVYTALAEACFAQGDVEAGEAALSQAVRHLEARLEDIPDKAARDRFLRQVPENARALELARQRGGP